MPDPTHPAVARLSRRQSLQIASVAVVLVVYPMLSDWALAQFGVRVTALVVAVLIAPASVLAGQRVAAAFGTRAPTSVGPILLTLAAAATGERLFLMLVPAAVHVVIFELFRASLRGPMSMIELGARVMEPHAPDFIRSYCRKLTILWAAFFLVSAFVIAALAFWSPAVWWPAYTGWIVWTILGVLSVVEFLVRKWWFRYYFYETPFDRFWSTLFPAEATPEGRRSVEYVRRTRQQLGRKP